MKYLKDGKRVVTGSADGTIAIFDISSSSKKPIVKKGHNMKIFSLDVDSDEKMMVSCGSGNEMVFWDFENMKIMKKVRADSFCTYNCKFLYGTIYVAASTQNGQLKLYNTFNFDVSA